MVKDYLGTPSEQQRDNDINYMFSSLERFTHRLKKMFKDKNQERKVEQTIRKLWQTKSASKYTIEFKQIEAKI